MITDVCCQDFLFGTEDNACIVHEGTNSDTKSPYIVPLIGTKIKIQDHRYIILYRYFGCQKGSTAGRFYIQGCARKFDQTGFFNLSRQDMVHVDLRIGTIVSVVDQWEAVRGFNSQHNCRASCSIDHRDLLGDYPAVQYVPPEGTFYLDIVTRLGEAFRYEDITSRRLDFDGLAVNVETPEVLYRMKKDTVRPKDWGDAEALRRRFKLEEE